LPGDCRGKRLDVRIPKLASVRPKRAEPPRLDTGFRCHLRCFVDGSFEFARPDRDACRDSVRPDIRCPIERTALRPELLMSLFETLFALLDKRPALLGILRPVQRRLEHFVVDLALGFGLTGLHERGHLCSEGGVRPGVGCLGRPDTRSEPSQEECGEDESAHADYDPSHRFSVGHLNE
jgi:hypothetical protein